MDGDAFLERYDRGQAREYFLKYENELFPSKAIIAGAYKHQHGESIGNFKGGKRVAQQLQKLGFEVVRMQDGKEQPIETEVGDQALTALPFVVGEEYNRRADIHGVYGGQWQGGISTPAQFPYVFIFTGDSGEQYGYEDGWLGDGTTYLYTGEGQRGDMAFKGGNAAIRDHAEEGKALLLFQALGKSKPVKFLGYFNCASWEYRQGLDADDAPRQTIQFQLVRDDAVVNDDELLEDDEVSEVASLEDLRRAAYDAVPAPRNTKPKVAARLYRKRSAAVKRYVLARAGGVCELTGEPAPFITKDGQPYLEVHHTLKLSDGGPDHPRWVAAISPNAHREIHFGENGNELNERLKAIVGGLEKDKKV
tara:strand:- start:14585 stop:15676 length:1092 start_codon:yes stop_codon:yes gene_type:complete